MDELLDILLDEEEDFAELELWYEIIEEEEYND